MGRLYYSSREIYCGQIILYFLGKSTANTPMSATDSGPVERMLRGNFNRNVQSTLEIYALTCARIPGGLFLGMKRGCCGGWPSETHHLLRSDLER